MSQYYNPKRTRNLFDPRGEKPFTLSRSKIDLFIECPRCFYTDRRLGTDRPPGFPFSLNSAVDALLKKEFDIYREEQTTHPIMIDNNIEAIPFKHQLLDDWRNFRKGIQVLHEQTNFLLTGAIDDVWLNPKDELMVVDYKATSKDGEVTLDEEWQDGYKRQMEFYQWLLRKSGFKVSSTGYFVYCNGDRSKDRFDNMLEFKINLIPYEGSDGWVERTIQDAHTCLIGDAIPKPGNDCDYCNYTNAIKNHQLSAAPVKTISKIL